MSRRAMSPDEQDYWHDLHEDRRLFGEEPYVTADVAGESGPKPVPTPEEQLAIVKALPVEATVAAMEDGRSPTPLLTANDVRRNLKRLFGDHVTLAHEVLHSREEDH